MSAIIDVKIISVEVNSNNDEESFVTFEPNDFDACDENGDDIYIEVPIEEARKLAAHLYDDVELTLKDGRLVSWRPIASAS